MSWALAAVVLLGGMQTALAEPTVAMRGRIAFLRCAACHHDGDGHGGPRSGVMDERYKIAISRFGNRLRVGA